MPKNIVVYSDGTGQDGGVRPEQRISNVYKMYRASRVHPDNTINPAEQVCFYDPGLGTDSDVSGLLSIVRTIQKLLQSVTGRGITENMIDCYAFIINQYQPGDRIYLIGFSRGAYTVRALANALMLCGIPTTVNGEKLHHFRKSVKDIAREAVADVYEHGAGHERREFEDEREEKARRFRAKYQSDFGEGGDKDQSNAAAYFIGVFDTVAALGASGLRRFAIQFGLGALFLFFAIVGGAVGASIPAAIVKWIFGLGFWWSELIITLVLACIAMAIFARRQHTQYTKTITDYPTKGESRSHQAEWKSGNFDRLLSKYVLYPRSAIAIDERRKDFDRVPWGNQQGAPQLIQRWFAGNHSDIGGSYSETESRLSDVALHWMIKEALRLPEPIKFGPITVGGEKIAGTQTDGTPLHLFPDGCGLQHCEISGTQDAVEDMTENWWPAWLKNWARSKNYEKINRAVPHDATVDATVDQRFALPEVVDCAKGTGPYRPEALRNHDKFKTLYPPPPADTSPTPTGRIAEQESPVLPP